MSSSLPCLLLALLAFLAAGAHALNITVRVLDGGYEERSLTLTMDAANSTVAVTWQQWDGPFLSSLLHTGQHLQAHAAMLLPERELGHLRTVRLCFITHGRVDTIPIPDMIAMRQDPNVLKTADEERSTEVLGSLRALRRAALSHFPASLRSFCSSSQAILMPQEDAVSFWGSDLDEKAFLRPLHSLRKLPLPCHVSACLLWVPCALSCGKPQQQKQQQPQQDDQQNGAETSQAARTTAERTCRVRVCRHCFRFEIETSPSARCS